MKKYQIVIAPDPVLRQTAKPVDKVDQEIKTLMSDMMETMHEAHGIGLAAPQIGILKRVIVMDVSDDNQQPNPIKMANPEIVQRSDDKVTIEEGCLSLPHQTGEVSRPAEIEVNYLDENGNPQTLKADKLLAACIQHEIDHLNGVLFVDYLSRIKRDIIMKKVRKYKKQLEAEKQEPDEAPAL